MDFMKVATARFKSNSQDCPFYISTKRIKHYPIVKIFEIDVYFFDPKYPQVSTDIPCTNVKVQTESATETA